jgi:hypothetical protein
MDVICDPWHLHIHTCSWAPVSVSFDVLDFRFGTYKQMDLLVQAFDANLSRAIPSFNAPLGTVIENHDYVRTLRLGGPIPHSGSAGLWQWCNLQQHGGSLDADLSRVIMRCVVQVPPVGGSLHIALLM